MDIDQVLKEEWEEILNEREKRLGKNLRKEEKDSPPVGLALSGGGIRSATVGLGVLQWLCGDETQVTGDTSSCEQDPPTKPESTLIEHIDYLSTVSGGGYIGAWFLANRLHESCPPSPDKRKGEAKQAAPPQSHPSTENNRFILDKGSPRIGHLRRFSSYLAPQAGLMSADTWTMVAIWFRNTFLLQSMVFCVVALIFLIARYWGALVTLMHTSLTEMATSTCVGSAFLVELGFIIVFVGLLAIAARQVRYELRCYEADDERDNQPGSAKARPIYAGDQRRVQQRIVIPTILSSFVLTLGLWWRQNCDLIQKNTQDFSFCNSAWGNGSAAILHDPLVWIACLTIGFLALMLVRTARDETEKHAHLTQFVVFIGVAITNVVMIYLLTQLFAGFAELPPFNKIDNKFCCPNRSSCSAIPFGGALAAVFGPTLITGSYNLVVVLGLGLMGRHMPDKVREWWSRLGAWLLIYCLAILATTGLAIFGPVLVDWLFHGDFGNWTGTGTLSGWLVTLASTILLGKSSKTNGKNSFQLNGALIGVTTFIAVFGLLVLGSWLLREILNWGDPSPCEPFLLGADSFQLNRHLLTTFTLIAIGGILVWRIDLNEFSMNHFYRNRLVRCYLGGAKPAEHRRFHPFTGFDFKDDLPLQRFRCSHPESAQFKGPYPLINAALNTAQGGDLDVQERKAESFLFSPLYCGFSRQRLDQAANSSHVQGYSFTEQYMVPPPPGPDMSSPWGVRESDPSKLKQDASITMGTAISISGAAASPNSGYHTSPPLAFLLTLFNARLGAWMSNPARKDSQQRGPKGLGYLNYLLCELFGCATPSAEFVYVSDGGHFDNLGLYELVRRRCRMIIVVDAEQDKNYGFYALGTAIRRCRVDFQADIHIDVSDIKPASAAEHSRSHGAVGIIHYPATHDKPQETGLLVYLKSSLTGDEGTDLRQYKEIHPEFPHESTGDQFFSESQFESYRELGRHMAKEMFCGALRRYRQQKSRQHKPLIHFLKDELEQRWLNPPLGLTPNFTRHTRMLDALWTELSQPGVPAILGELVLTNWNTFQSKMPDATSPSSAPSKRRAKAIKPATPDSNEARQIYAYCLRMIQLMENVFLDLRLDVEGRHLDNRGWMHLFKHWANHPVMRTAWENSHQIYGERFQKFWEDL